MKTTMPPINLFELYKGFVETPETVAAEPGLVMQHGRLRWPDGEEPTIAALAYEAIRRGLRGPEVDQLLRDVGRRHWAESLSPAELKAVDPEGGFLSDFLGSKHILQSCGEVLALTTDAEILAELAARKACRRAQSI
jgi:hypothetical protein